MLASPMSVDINLTNRCNLRCSFCSATPFHHSTSADELTLDEIGSLLEQLDDMGVFLVRLAGGEPLVRKDIIAILEETRRRSFDKILLTNGVLLDDRIIAAVRDTGVNSLAISVDGPTAAMHDAHRGVTGTFDTVMSNVERLARAGVLYTAMTTVTRRNCGSLVEIVKELDRRGFASVNFILLNLSGMARSTGGDFASWSEWKGAFLDLTHFLAERRLRIAVSVVPPHEDPLPYEMYVPLRDTGELHLLPEVWGLPSRAPTPATDIGCAAGKTQLTIFENGDVFGCELMRDFNGWKAGNIREQSVEAIWSGSPAFARLRAMRKSDLDGACGVCSLEVCGGGCRASAYNSTAMIHGSDSNCHLGRRQVSLPVLQGAAT